MKSRKFIVIALALALVLDLITGCIAAEQPQGAPIKIGHIVDLTGVEAMTGEEARRSLDFAVEMFGRQFAGRPVEVIVRDSQSSASVAADVARQLVEREGVVAIFGPTQVGHKQAVAAYVADEARIPLIFYNGTSPMMMQNNPWVVAAGGATAQMPSVAALYAYEVLGYRKVHTISQDNPGGRGYVNPFVEMFTALGGTVVSQQWVVPPAPDLSPYLANLEDADALVGWLSGSDGIQLWNAWWDLGIKDRMPIFSCFHGGFTDYYIFDEIARSNPDLVKAMLGTVSVIAYSAFADHPENVEFVEKWKERFGAIPAGTNLPGACYQAIVLFNAAMEATGGDTDPDKLINAIFSADITGPEGHLFFDNSQAATKEIFIVEVIQMPDATFNYNVLKVYNDVPPRGASAMR